MIEHVLFSPKVDDMETIWGGRGRGGARWRQWRCISKRNITKFTQVAHFAVPVTPAS